MKTYVTFGQIHRHEIGDKIFDKDCVAVIKGESIEENYAKIKETFGRKYCMEYFDLDDVGMEYYPRGLIKVD